MERLEIRKQLKGFLGAVPVCGLITICLEVGLAFLHRGGSIEKHLIHFAILLLAAWGIVLLYGAVPSVRKIWKRIDREILSVDKRKPWVDIVYAALAMILLLHHFYVLLYYPKIPAGASRFAPAWIPFAVITVLMGKLWRNKGFWICAVFAAYMFERTYLKNPDITGETMVYMVSMIYALVICYGALEVIRPKYRRGSLRVLCILWTVATLAFCGAGLYYSWSGNVIHNLGGGTTGPDRAWVNNATEVRLSIFSNSNITGGIAACSAMFVLVGFAVTKNYVSKVLYIAACFLMMVTNALAVTRSCFIMLSFAVAGMVTLALWGLMKKHVRIRGCVNVPLAIGLIVCMAGCMWGTYMMQQRLGNAFLDLRDRDGLIVSSAKAEEAEKAQTSKSLPKLSGRRIASDHLSIIDLVKDVMTGQLDEEKLNHITNGRWNIWKTTFEYTEKKPDTIFLGLSADGSVMEAINNKDAIDPQPHCHNILIQMFMEGGIPGIGLYLALLGYFVFHACRLWKWWELPLWQRALPVPVFAVMLMEMVECLTHFAYGHVPMTVLYLFMGATVAVSKQVPGLRSQVSGEEILRCAQDDSQGDEQAILA